MPNKHFYVAMGAVNGTLVVVAIRQARNWLHANFAWFRRLQSWDRDWYLYFPLVLLPFMVWALVPDILHGTALLPKETTRGPWFDVFYFHSTFEILEDADPVLDRVLNGLGSLALLVIALGINFFYVREYHRRHRTNRRLPREHDAA